MSTPPKPKEKSAGAIGQPRESRPTTVSVGQHVRRFPQRNPAAAGVNTGPGAQPGGPVESGPNPYGRPPVAGFPGAGGPGGGGHPGLGGVIGGVLGGLGHPQGLPQPQGQPGHPAMHPTVQQLLPLVQQYFQGHPDAQVWLQHLLQMLHGAPMPQGGPSGQFPPVGQPPTGQFPPVQHPGMMLPPGFPQGTATPPAAHPQPMGLSMPGNPGVRYG